MPDSVYVCWILVEPLIAPRERLSPSPKSMTTSRTFAVALTPTVKVAGTPAEMGVVGAVSVTPVRGRRVTLTSAVFPETLAVTLVAAVVVSVVVARPLLSVTAVEFVSTPLSVVNVTRMPGTAEPVVFSVRACTVAVPPLGGSVCGETERSTRSIAAEPTARFSSFPEAPPENAVIVAAPL